jgi:hypothetical protein
MPPPPGRGSTTIGCPRRSDQRLLTARAIVSDTPPPGKSMIQRIGFCG